MPSVTDLLQLEHANLDRLVRLLDRHPAECARGERAEIELLVDALYYLTHFPDVSHHPLEDEGANSPTSNLPLRQPKTLRRIERPLPSRPLRGRMAA